MSVYADTGFICSLHAPDSNTSAAIVRMEKQRAPIPFTAFHRLEFRNAMRLRVFRGEITAEQRELSIQAMLTDLASEVFCFTDPSLTEAFVEAERLSATHSERLGTRSIDILHVGCALLLGANEFWTFDKRQLALAAASGLSAPAL